VFLCGDDAQAKQPVAALARDLGYDPVDASRWRRPATLRRWPGYW
jgi:predicted dinucleotide-binding enzyme